MKGFIKQIVHHDLHYTGKSQFPMDGFISFRPIPSLNALQPNNNVDSTLKELSVRGRGFVAKLAPPPTPSVNRSMQPLLVFNLHSK